MRAFQITETGNFMTKLLSGETFDLFLLEEASLHMQINWTIDGHINMDFYTQQEQEKLGLSGHPLVEWGQVRPGFRSLILGKKAPTALSIVLHCPAGQMEKALLEAGLKNLLEYVGAMVLTVRYDGAQVTLVTGIALKNFTMDKQADAVWDEMVVRFLSDQGIAFTEL